MYSCPVALAKILVPAVGLHLLSCLTRQEKFAWLSGFAGSLPA